MTAIKVLSAGAVEGMVKAIGADFEKATGHRLDLNFGTAGALRDRLKGGEAADFVIVPAAIAEAMDKAGAFVPGSRTDLGRTVTGVAVREGAPLPDISTPEAFKQALLDAATVSFTDPKAGGSSGNNFIGLLDKLGIADAVHKKAVLGNRGFDVVTLVAAGKAEIGTTFISEILIVPGAQLVGPLPAALQFANTYTAAIPVGSASRDVAAAFLGALTDPASRGRWTAAGLEPAFP